MDLPLTEYLLSPYVSIDTADGRQDKFKLTNSLTGRTFELGEKVVTILRMFRAANTFATVLDSSGVEEEDLQKLAEVFIETRLLVPADNPEEYAVALSKTGAPMFGVGGGTTASGRSIDLIGVPFGKGNDKGYGTEGAPNALRDKTTHLQFNQESMRHVSFDFLDSQTNFEPLARYFCEGAIRDLGNVFFHFNETIDYCYSKIEAIAGTRFASASVPVFLGGDHSITYPIIKAAANRYPALRVLHFDAHLDTYYSKYDELRHARKISHNHGNFMRHCLELPQLERVYHFGVRGLSNRFSASSDKQRILWLEDIRTFLATQKPSGVWAELAGEPDDCYYYITLDIDVLDPAVAPGTATPVINGLNLNELVTLFRRLLPNKRIIGLDLVELDPTLDHHGLTTQCAINLLLHLLNLVVL